jgi:hypothetical protein
MVMVIDGPMTDIDSKIRTRIEAFVVELTGLIREAAVAKVAEALGGEVAPRGRGRGIARSAAGGGGGKRTAEEIDAQCEQITSFVTKNPGLGVEGIASGLGTSSKELTLPIRKLLASKELTRKGHKRATKYFPGRPRK